MYCIVLYYYVLKSTILHGTIMYCNEFNETLKYSVKLNNTILKYRVWGTCANLKHGRMIKSVPNLVM